MRGSDAFSSGRASDLLQLVRATRDEAGPEAALSLLTSALPQFQPVPAGYLAMMGRMLWLVGRPAEAVTYLTEACGRFKQIPIWVHRDLGDVHLALRQFDLAGQHFSAIETRGQHLKPVPQMLACEAYRLRSGNGPSIQDSFTNRFTVCDFCHNVSYVFIPKVACTVLKLTVVMNGDLATAYRASGKTIHQFVGVGGRPAPPGRHAPFRFTVLRDPSSRLLSAYLNKFVRTPPAEIGAAMLTDINRTIGRAQSQAGIPLDLDRSITFEEFVRYVAGESDFALNEHWLPQHRFTGDDLGGFDHVGVFERLDATFDLLADRFGYIPQRDAAAHIRAADIHITPYDSSVALEAPYRMPPAALNAPGQGLPSAEMFYTPELLHLVRTRYAADLDMHQRLFGDGH